MWSWSKDADGNRVVTERTKKISPGGSPMSSGTSCSRSGFKVLELEKGKAGIVVGSMDKLDGVLIYAGFGCPSWRAGPDA